MAKKATLDLEVSVSTVQAIRLFRELAEEANWSLERHEGSRLVDRFAIIMPMAQATRTLGLKVLDGPMRGMELTCWSETRGSSGAVNIASWLVPGGSDQPLFRDLVQHWVARMDRCPWRWTFGERSTVGYLLPVWRQARRRFSDLGFNTKKSGWPMEIDGVWPTVEATPERSAGEEE
tara:strand:+ start:1170 stop:1700 length:531 start_codon:yes stop_codon:yes gene_type:complete